MSNPLEAQTQLTCFELSRPVTSANTVFTRATSGRNTASPHHSGPGDPPTTRVLSEASGTVKNTLPINSNKTNHIPNHPGGGPPTPMGNNFSTRVAPAKNPAQPDFHRANNPASPPSARSASQNNFSGRRSRRSRSPFLPANARRGR